MNEERITIKQLKKLFDKVIGPGEEHAFSILVSLTGALSEEITKEDLDRASNVRVTLYKKLKELQSETIQFEKLCSHSIGRGIRP